MNPKVVLAFALLAIAAHQANSAACLCGLGEGKDICSSSSHGRPCQTLVIRPAQLPRINPEVYTKPRVVCQTIGGGVNNPFKPIGDLCSCRQSIVIPALVPRPVCACATSSSGSSSSSAHTSSSSASSSGCGGAPIYLGSGAVPKDTIVEYETPSAGYVVEEQRGPTSAVVDPVSLALAYKEANRACGTSESGIAYGFKTLPVVVESESTKREEINEHGLHECRGDVVEMKRIACGRPISLDDEALDDLKACEEAAALEEDVALEGRAFKALRFSDVGYGVEKVEHPRFKVVQGEAVVVQAPVGRTCADGYRPGNVITKSTPYEEEYVPPPRVPVDCPASGEDCTPYYKYATSSSSSSSSNNNCHQCAHSKVFY